jgi:hypothetical protein
MDQRFGWATSGVGLDRVMAGLGLWFEGGLFLDLWAHSRGLVAAREGFITPWHIVFYTGFLALAGLLTIVVVRNRRAGRSWRMAIPLGYELAAVAVPLFMLSGVADFIKHTLYGFDLAAEAPINPSHLGITLGMGLLISGPLRAASKSPLPSRWWVDRWPAVASLAEVFTAATVIVQFSSPLAKVWADRLVMFQYFADPNVAESLAISGMLVTSALLVGFLLPAIRHGILPIGALAGIMAFNAALMTIQYSQYRLIPAALAAGLAYDGLAIALRRPARRWLWKVTGALLPVIFFAFYLLTLALTGVMWWPLHVWTGALALVGAAGWGISLLSET